MRRGVEDVCAALFSYLFLSLETTVDQLAHGRALGRRNRTWPRFDDRTDETFMRAGGWPDWKDDGLVWKAVHETKQFGFDSFLVAFDFGLGHDCLLPCLCLIYSRHLIPPGCPLKKSLGVPAEESLPVLTLTSLIVL